jgi:hypothetical protein
MLEVVDKLSCVLLLESNAAADNLPDPHQSLLFLFFSDQTFYFYLFNVVIWAVLMLIIFLSIQYYAQCHERLCNDLH